MFKLFTLTLTLLSCTGAISQNAADTVITTLPDSVTVVKASDSIVVPIVKVYELKPGTVQPGADSLAHKIAKENINTPTQPPAVSSHAPMVGDPDFAKKYEEWKNKYPDEYAKQVPTAIDTNFVKQMQEQAARDAQQQTKTVSTPEKNSNLNKQNPVELPPGTVMNAGNHKPIYADSIKNNTNVNTSFDSNPDLLLKQEKQRMARQKESDSMLVLYKKSLIIQKESDSLLLITKQELIKQQHCDSLLVLENQNKLHQRVTDSIANLNILIAEKTRKINDSIQAYKADSIRNIIIIPIKAAEHAPNFDDPDYSAKKDEWIKKYPDEYKKSLDSIYEVNPALKDTSKLKAQTDTISVQAYTEVNLKKNDDNTKSVCKHYPAHDDNYNEKMKLWVNKHTDELETLLHPNTILSETDIERKQEVLIWLQNKTPELYQEIMKQIESILKQ